MFSWIFCCTIPDSSVVANSIGQEMYGIVMLASDTFLGDVETD